MRSNLNGFVTFERVRCLILKYEKQDHDIIQGGKRHFFLPSAFYGRNAEQLMGQQKYGTMGFSFVRVREYKQAERFKTRSVDVCAILSVHGSNELKLLRSISVSESSILIKYCDTSANLASKFGDMTTYLL